MSKLFIGNAGFIGTNPKTVAFDKVERVWKEVDAIPTELSNIPSQQRDEFDIFYYWFIIVDSPVKSQIGTTINTDCINTLIILQQLGIIWESDTAYE